MRWRDSGFCESMDRRKVHGTKGIQAGQRRRIGLGGQRESVEFCFQVKETRVCAITGRRSGEREPEIDARKRSDGVEVDGDPRER